MGVSGRFRHNRQRANPSGPTFFLLLSPHFDSVDILCTFSFAEQHDVFTVFAQRLLLSEFASSF